MNAYEKIITGVVLAAMMVTAGLITYAWAGGSQGTINSDLLATFSDREEVSTFLKSSERQGYDYSAMLAPKTAMGDNALAALEYSRTNVQVAGVDELDTVKTDGTYLYLSSWDEVNIIKAYPPSDLQNVSQINKTQIIGSNDQNVSVWFSGVFVLPGRLVVIYTLEDITWWSWWYQPNIMTRSTPVLESPGPRTFVGVFDIDNPAEPKLVYSVGVSGSSFAARMIDHTVYLIAQEYPWWIENATVLPRVWIDDETREFALSKIHYDPEMRDAGSFLNILAVDVVDETYDYESIVAGYATTMYMSKQAIYLTIQKWIGRLILLDGEEVAEDSDTTVTTIYKVSFDGLSMRATARGDVKGWLLNQFSMDEKEPYLRVATTNSWTSPSNSVYVLDEELKTVGLLNGIAPSERIFSARFIGDTLYLVTFRQIDPLFVIDLSDASSPKIVGQLEMPGFSSYLHPVDDNHVLGIGSENGKVKISLYDVSDPENPVEKSKYVLDSYSWSSASYEHKAVLFDLERQLLVVPVYAYSWTGDYSSWVDGSGAYVFSVSLENGISLRGIVQHEAGAYGGSELPQRSLYIGDYLYTISYSIVKASRLADLTEVGSLVYMTPSWYYAVY